MLAAQEKKEDQRRTVIVTSFGLHDASSLLRISQRRKGLEDSFRASTLATCRDATAQFAHHAAAAGDDSHISPLVFLLQSSGGKPGGLEQMFLDELYRAQRQEIGFETEIEVGVRDKGEGTERRGQSDGGEGESVTNDRRGAGDNRVVDDEGFCDGGGQQGVFVVEDIRSKLQCNRQDTSSHFREHANVVEAKMLWDLIALVDRENSFSPTPTAQATRNETAVEAEPSWAAVGAREVNVSGSSEVDAVWSRLQEAATSQDECVSPPCGNVSATNG